MKTEGNLRAMDDVWEEQALWVERPRDGLFPHLSLPPLRGSFRAQRGPGYYSCFALWFPMTFHRENAQEIVLWMNK